jgi:hypothetical protein
MSKRQRRTRQGDIGEYFTPVSSRANSPEPVAMDSSMMVDQASGYEAGGREVQLDRPFRPANKMYEPRNAWKVPKWQYNRLKKHILAKNKKRKSSTRRSSGYSGSRGTMSGMGPIVITGRGGYYTDKLKSAASAGYRAMQRHIPTGTFGRIGAAAGGSLFGMPGAAVGRFLGGQVANVAGFGDYTISKNDLLNVDEGMQVPTFGDLNHGIMICHREYLGDISIPATPANFTLASYSINPGLNSTFPWLSQIAAQFDQYEIHGMLFQFKSTSSDFGTTTSLAMGTVILATDYDSAESSYASKSEMENAQYSTSCKPSIDCIHAIECDPAFSFTPLKYVRTGAVPSSKDVRLYDQGNFQIATVGLPTGSSGVIGELWCTYKIAFYKPQLSAGASVLTDDYSTGGTGVDNSNPLGTQTANGLSSSSGGGSISATTYTFPTTVFVGGKFLIHYSVVGSSTTLTTALVPVLTGMTATFSRIQPAGVISTTLWYIGLVTITSSTATFALNGAAHSSPNSPTSLRFLVTQLDRDFTY